MNSWNADFAADRLANRGYQCHHQGTKSACFTVKGPQPREVAISLARKNGVTAYVNHCSSAGLPYPSEGLDGIQVLEKYVHGHQGVNGNPGIAGSVARKNPSLDPASNDVLRIEVRDEASLDRLLAWYAGN